MLSAVRECKKQVREAETTNKVVESENIQWVAKPEREEIPLTSACRN